MKQPGRVKPTTIPDWFREAKFGMFIHWGIYAVGGRGESSLGLQFLDPSDYRRMADQFRAESYDPNAWAALAREANMKYMVLTAKHHDGFCLWDTKTTSYNAAQHAAGRDLIAEYVKACRRAGLRCGLYYSVPDWNVPASLAGPKRDPSGAREFVRLIWRQIEELVSSYGRIDLLWFDSLPGSWPGARELRSNDLVRMIRSHQPGILINDRLPKPKAGGDWGFPTPEQRLGTLSGQPWETCLTSTYSGWGWDLSHEDPGMWRTKRELLTALVTCIGRGGNLLLNVGPYADGRLPQLFAERARFLGDWLRRNGRAIHGTSPAQVEFRRQGVVTQRANHLYLLFVYWPGPDFSLQGFNEKLRSARFLATGEKIQARQESHRIVFSTLPRQAPELCPVVELVFDAPPTPHPWATHRFHMYPMPGLEEWARR